MSVVPETPAFDRAHLRELLYRMVLIRRFEEAAAERYSAGDIQGFLHLYIGEEAVAAGAVGLLGPGDRLVCTYREHGHALVRGTPAGAIMAEMYGKQEGCSKGRGGSMHLFDIPRGLYGGNAIVGGHLPLAVGLGLSDRMQERDLVTACFFGEGAVAEGEFHESMNLAALWRCPVLFACENNSYAMGSALDRTESQTDLCVKARSYGVVAESVDGMDVLAVQDATRRALEHIRRTGEPFFMEYRTYRFRAHSMFDAQLYRSKEEVKDWREHRDPIELFMARMTDEGHLGPDDLEAVEAEVAEVVKEAVAFAAAGTVEPFEQMLADVMTPRGEVRP